MLRGAGTVCQCRAPEAISYCPCENSRCELIEGEAQSPDGVEVLMRRGASEFTLEQNEPLDVFLPPMANWSLHSMPGYGEVGGISGSCFQSFR